MTLPWVAALMEAGLLDQAELQRAQQVVDSWGEPLAGLLLGSTAPRAEQRILAAARWLGIPRVADEDVRGAPRSLARLLPRPWAEGWDAVPFLRDGTDVCVALWDPASVAAAQKQTTVNGLHLRVMLASQAAVQTTRAELYPPEGLAPPTVVEPRTPSPPPEEEVSNRDFAAALGLEDSPPASSDTVLLFRRKPTPAPGPAVLTRRKQDPAAPTHAVNVEPLLAAESVTALAEALVEQLARGFERLVVLDLGHMPARVVARRNTLMVTQRQIHMLPGVAQHLAQPGGYCGPAPTDAAWRAFALFLGEARVDTVLVLPVFKGQHARLMVYADSSAGHAPLEAAELHRLARHAGVSLNMLDD